MGTEHLRASATGLDIDTIEAEWEAAGESEQREWAVSYADVLIAEARSLRVRSVSQSRRDADTFASLYRTEQRRANDAETARDEFEDAYVAATERAERAEAALARVTDDSMTEVAAKAAYEGAFLKHAPEDVDRWEDLVADNHPAAESWREVARAVIRAVAENDSTT